MKKKIKLILSRYKLLLYITNVLIFFKKNNNQNITNWNSFLFFTLNLLNQNNISLIPFFGTLLGLYREGGIIKHDNDIDFAIIKNHETKNIINFLLDNKFIKIYDCSIVETNQITVEKYKYKNFEIDIFYIYEDKDKDCYYFYDNESNSGLSTIEEINNNIVVNPYKNIISKFKIKNLSVNNHNFFGPENPKLTLKELYGDNFMKPDKFWRQEKRLNRLKTKFKLVLNES